MLDNRDTRNPEAVDVEDMKPESSDSPPPVYGLMSVVGRKREMEDEISVKMNLCRPEINGYRPVHFFGVFDGQSSHHINHLSRLCKENMHVIMEEELMRVKATPERLTGGEAEELWKMAINRTFDRIDAMAVTLFECFRLENYDVCRQHRRLSVIGSTVVVVLLTQDYIIVGNCGDSRAILCRDRIAIPLSVDHKRDREVEQARIEALGGRVLFAANVARVEGVQAMTQAIGDKFLRRLLTSKPEYVFMKRQKEDKSLILGSDGLWDVVSNELCCEMVYNCQQEDVNDELGVAGLRAVHGDGPLYTVSAAAAFLARLAMGRRSTVNISVVVVDLRR